MTPLCRHILAAGHACRQPALKDQLFCRFHHQAKKLTRRYAPNVAYTLPFVFPEDHAALQLNAFITLQALTEGRIDVKTAHAMNSLLRTARLSFTQTTRAKSNSESAAASAGPAVQRVILTPEGEEIAPPREQLEEHEDPPVHGEDCPCRKCAEEFRGAAPEKHHAGCKCGLCEDEAEGAARIAGAQKLYDKEPAKIHAGDEDSPGESPYKAVIREYEARQAAIKAGLIERPAPKPLGPNEPEPECIRRYNEKMAEVERNKQIGREIWERRFANKESQQAQPNPPNAPIQAEEQTLIPNPYWLSANG